jgi:hypothetical protein
VSERSLHFMGASGQERVLARVRGGLKELEAVSNGTVLKDTMQIVEHIFFMKVGDHLLQAKYEFGLPRLNLILLPDLIERHRSPRFLPLRLGEFQELIEDEVRCFLAVPTVGHQPAPQPTNLPHQGTQRITLFSLHLNYKG